MRRLKPCGGHPRMPSKWNVSCLKRTLPRGFLSHCLFRRGLRDRMMHTLSADDLHKSDRTTAYIPRDSCFRPHPHDAVRFSETPPASTKDTRGGKGGDTDLAQADIQDGRTQVCRGRIDIVVFLPLGKKGVWRSRSFGRRKS